MTLPISTTSLHGHPFLFPSITSHLNPKHTHNDELLRLFSSKKPTTLTPRFTSLKAASAIADSHYSLVLAATNPPMSGDISVILKTSAVMLFMYFIANFFIPSIISKSSEFDEEKKDSSPKA